MVYLHSLAYGNVIMSIQKWLQYIYLIKYYISSYFFTLVYGHLQMET